MSWFLLNRNLTLLEPYDWKLSCTVLRGERGSNAPDLPGKAIASPLMAEYIKFMYIRPPESSGLQWAWSHKRFRTSSGLRL